MILVTGASDNHFRSLLQFLYSVPSEIVVFVWDLGLSPGNLDSLHSLQRSRGVLHLRRFPYEEYPTWFEIGVNAGEYAWKPVAIWRTALEVGEGVVLWCDAGDRIVGDMRSVEEVIQRQGVYSPISAGTVRMWTHQGCLDWFVIEEGNPILGLSPRNGAIVGFHLGNGSAWRVLEEWADLAQKRECIAPVGSSRENHRQDQAVFTILYYRFTGGLGLCNEPIGILTHQDCDSSTS